MKCKIFTFQFSIVFACSFLASASAAEIPSNDVTAAVEHLGIPHEKLYPSGPRIYARNVWDLQAFNGKLFIGGGNSSNIGPASNAGPLPILAWDPKTKQFEGDFKVADEQIDVFYIFDGELYTPGHDPKEDWKLGNFYRLEPDGKWVKHRNLPNGIHNYAMAWHNKQLFAGLGTKQGSTVAISSDKGATWTVSQTAGTRIHAFLEVDGELFSTDMFFSPDIFANWKGPEDKKPQFTPVFQYDGKEKFVARKDLDAKTIFPGVEFNTTQRQLKAVKPLTIGKACAYIGGFCHNDHQFMPAGVFVAESLKADAVKVRALPLPEGARVWDIMAHDGVLYALLDQPDGEGRIVSVAASRDLAKWQEVLRFKSPTFARSFELLDGDLYFGLGCEVADALKWTQAELHKNTGEVLRVAKDKFVLPK